MQGCQSNKVVLFNNHEDIQIDDFSEKSLQIKFDNHLLGKDSLQKST